MTTAPPRIRPARADDLPAVAALGAALARQHAAYDARRFSFTEPLEAAHAVFFAEQLASTHATLLVAEPVDGGRPVGYVLARREPASFVDALPASGWVHDLYVDPGARGCGAGAALLDAAVAALRAAGVGIVLLTVAAANAAARRTFEGRGFRTTMHEMARDLATLALLVGGLAVGGPTGCSGTEGADRGGRVAEAAPAARDTLMPPVPPMPPSGTPMAHMDMERHMAHTMSDTGAGMRSGMCAVGSTPMDHGRARAGGRRVALVVDAAAARRPSRITVAVADMPRAGLSAAWVVPGRPRAACAGDDLMITHVGPVGDAARLELASRGPVTVVARTADGSPLAGPMRLGPGARDAVLAWGATGRRAMTP